MRDLTCVAGRGETRSTSKIAVKKLDSKIRTSSCSYMVDNIKGITSFDAKYSL